MIEKTIISESWKQRWKNKEQAISLWEIFLHARNKNADVQLRSLNAAVTTLDEQARTDLYLRFRKAAVSFIVTQDFTPSYDPLSCAQPEN